MHLKDKVTAESVRLQKTIENNNDLAAIKAARSRWENAYRAYWEAVHAARDELEADKRKRPESVSEVHGIDPLDLMEVTRGD